ncbi:WAT1-related protein At1g25270-like [Hevea brasiliensis]|uniref:WAT1-related protein At1g25270-like n=1 Tax=Hevea brasiliensis TaxID=3981 RepID=UPI0025D4FE17|nr:WAT1-related protein At1g25270-like [Hevea brasiliensis]
MKKVEEIFKLVNRLKPVLVMVVVQVGFAGVNLLYKVAASYGMSLRIIVAYRFIFATAFMIPLSLFFERSRRPKLTWTVLFQAFLSGLFGGSLSQNLHLESIALTSATFASAMNNLVPAVTFILAISFGLEKVGLKTPAGKAKLVGTVMGIGGAMLFTFYKGSEINIWRTQIDLLKHYHSSHGHPALGCLLAMGTCFSNASWLIIQAKMSERYPYPYSSTMLMSFMASIQAVVFALSVEKDWSQWKLGWNIMLLTAAYAGIIVAGVLVTLQIWCLRLRGPLFVSIFNPLMLICTALVGSILLNEKLHLGSVLGGTLIVCGLYAVLWGKDKEAKKMSQLVPSKNPKEPIDNIITSPCDDAGCNTNLNIDEKVLSLNPILSRLLCFQYLRLFQKQNPTSFLICLGLLGKKGRFVEA